MYQVFTKNASNPTSSPRLNTLGTHLVKASCEHWLTPHVGNQIKQHELPGQTQCYDWAPTLHLVPDRARG